MELMAWEDEASGEAEGVEVAADVLIVRLESWNDDVVDGIATDERCS